MKRYQKVYETVKSECMRQLEQNFYEKYKEYKDIVQR